MTDGENSDWFETSRGIYQGAPWSMLLYQLFNNKLLKELKEATFGSSVGGIITTCPTFADDLTLIALSKIGLQQLLNIAYSFSVKWRYEYNSEKCAVLIFGNDINPSKNLTIGNNVIQMSKKETHLGILLTNHKKLNRLIP